MPLTLIALFRSMAHLGLADDGFIPIPHTNNQHTTAFTPTTSLNQPDQQLGTGTRGGKRRGEARRVHVLCTECNLFLVVMLIRRIISRGRTAALTLPPPTPPSSPGLALAFAFEELVNIALA